MAAMVVTTTMALDTTAPSVPVMARWAPITSLFIRLTRAPVWVRVKKPSGMRCTWSNSATRRSKISPSPILEDHRRSKRERAASPTATSTIRPGQQGHRAAVLVGQGVVDDAGG